MTIENSVGEEMYRRMVRIRAFEELAEEMHAKGLIVGSLHSSIGQEGEIVGACMALRTDDYMMGNHRSHGHPIAKGAKLNPLMAELFGRKTGICQGKGGSMHLADFSVGSIGETSIVGSGLPVATGAALACKLQGIDRVSLCFFGDGASNEGTFHESLNLAAVWKLPVIFICENNLYACSTSVEASTAVTNIADRAAGYAIPGVVVDGQDVLAVHDAVSAAVYRARSGQGPTLIEAKTYRYRDHAVNMGKMSDIDIGSRSVEEVEHWQLRDPIPLFRKVLVDDFGVSSATLDTIESEAREDAAESLRFAQESAFPEPAEAFEDVFVSAKG
ncbi:thiamine pyrophosphate-dependent dehydrogenase E1 component subunit alpha [Sphingosinicella xenopeptidilytica]|uniref:Thiamine pyrophosphate-dependent dehydrogenase E1 component subunit alpha n=1 Tax=Sphingosinicella xenopeptidilytica TaxID=364098 RepID=A0ABW3BXX4_SPHXN|nr:thiamine pyrophosphate-dependent dehydrogenase E1 component subunit alpha [Sphingosinicella sp.]